MAYQQVRIPKVMIPVEGGWCLKYVDDTVGAIAAMRQPNAMAAYNLENKNGNVRTERPPAGVYVPVFFSLSNNAAGHVALALPDGRVASATKAGQQSAPYIHPNIDDLIKVYSGGRTCTYLGWSTYCDGRQYVEQVAGPTPTPAPTPSPSVTVYGTGYINNAPIIGRIAAFMRKNFPVYTPTSALGNYFGPNLTAAVKEFQRRTGLAADGNVGPITMAKLKTYGFGG